MGNRPALLFLTLALACPAAARGPALKKAAFAGGCFWCLQPQFDHEKGVVKTTVGYMGGTRPRPTYEEVSSGGTGHAESIEVVYDPSRVSYSRLLDIYWKSINPTQADGQFVDQGSQYRTIIFYFDDEQKKLALESKKRLERERRFPGPIVTRILSATGWPFYPAEDYHQKYYLKSKLRYDLYHDHSGRREFLEKYWGHDKD